MGARIVLEDGRSFGGRWIGASREAGGEVVFHTGMIGYQEILTDPSYAGQIVLFTAAHIGNYGVHAGEDESAAIHPAAILVRDFCRRTFHRKAEHGLDAVLRRAGVPALTDVDTRALTIAIREGGTRRAWIGRGDPDRLAAKARALPAMGEIDWVSRVTSSAPWILDPPALDREGPPRDPFEVSVLDLGVKRSILRRIAREGCRVRVFPASTPPEEVAAPPAEGVFLSNGPGDPAALPAIAANVRRLVHSRLPLFGICLGHQLLARALGAETVKLPFGHHGANHPVLRLEDGRVEITSQNHNYAAVEESIPPGAARVTHRSLNDGTVEGLEVTGQPVFSVQYHPEAAPGPSDSQYLFGRFRRHLEAARASRAAARRGG